MSAQTLRIHPENQGYFLGLGDEPVILIGSHHLTVDQEEEFDPWGYVGDPYRILDLWAHDGLNYITLWRPLSFHAFARTGPGSFTTSDGRILPKYDLTRFNESYFAQLGDVLSYAETKGVYVQIKLFSWVYPWSLDQTDGALRAANNVQGVGWPSCDIPTVTHCLLSMENRQMLEVEERYVRRLVQEVNGCDNICFEVCNEPGLSDARVAGWYNQFVAGHGFIARVVKDAESSLPKQHLVAANPHNHARPRDDTSLFNPFYEDSLFDILNFHSWHGEWTGKPGMGLGEKPGSLRRFWQALRHYHKPLVLDEDNLRNGGSREGTTAADAEAEDPKLAWESVVSGGHYKTWPGPLMFSPTTVQRKRLGYILRFLRENRVDFVHMIADDDVVVQSPGAAFALAKSRRQYLLYLPQVVAGQRLVLDLPRGAFVSRWFAAADGLYVQEDPRTAHTGGPWRTAIPGVSSTGDVALFVEYLPELAYSAV